MYLQFILLISFSIVLALSTNLVLKSIKKISRKTGLSNYSLANILIAMGTSLPELLIAIKAGLAGQSSLSLGNVLGSNIADLSVVIGGATLISGHLKINHKVINNDIYYAFLISAAPLILLADGRLGLFDGILLLLLFSFWQAVSFKSGRIRKDRSILVSIKKRLGQKLSDQLLFDLIKLGLGLAGLVIASNQLVNSAQFLALHFKISPLIIGIFIIGLGTSLPELALEVRAIKNKEAEVAIGDLLGSIVVNSSLIIGVTAVIRAIDLTQPRIYLTTTLFFLSTFLIFYLFIRSKRTLERWEGAILLMLYFVLVSLELF